MANLATTLSKRRTTLSFVGLSVFSFSLEVLGSEVESSEFHPTRDSTSCVRQDLYRGFRSLIFQVVICQLPPALFPKLLHFFLLNFLRLLQQFRLLLFGQLPHLFAPCLSISTHQVCLRQLSADFSVLRIRLLGNQVSGIMETQSGSCLSLLY